METSKDIQLLSGVIEFLSDYIGLNDIDLNYVVFKSTDFNVLVKQTYYEDESVTEMQKLLSDIFTNFSLNSLNYNETNIITKHSGGKQAFTVYECWFQNKKVAIKLYKSIVTHLIVHSIARDYITKYLTNFNDFDIKLFFPDTIAIGQIKLRSGKVLYSFLIQEWVEKSEEIHKFFPKEHVTIIKKIIKKLTTDNGFMVDIMSKNWLATENNVINYIDLVLFNPKGKILEKIKYLTQQIE